MSDTRSRRSFMKLAAIGGALPFFKLLERSAFAQATAPMRFLFIYSPDGYAYEYWRPRAMGSSTPGSGTENSFTLDFDQSVLKPLIPLQKKLLIIDALDFECAYATDHPWDGTGHNALGTLLTGSQNLGTSFNHPGPSLDQYLAKKIGATKVPVLNLAVGENFGWTIMNQMVFSQSGSWVSEIQDPTIAYQLLFKDFQGGAAQGMTDPAAAARLARAKNKLAYDLADVQRLRSKLAGPEAVKLDVHLDALRTIERGLDATQTTPPLTCSKPAAPNLGFNYETDGRGPQPSQMAQLLGLQTDLLAQAFACDLTRVATFRMGQSWGVGAMPYLGAAFDDDLHNKYQHNATSLRDSWKYDAVTQALAKMQNFHAQQVAMLLGKLDAIPEGDGTVLDHTLVMWGCEMGNPAAHNSTDLGFVLAGGGGKLRTGRYLNLKPGGSNGMIPHNKLLVSVLQAFGLADDSYGWADSKGPLSGLT
jgi:hypothetical protein